jgi:integrase
VLIPATACGEVQTKQKEGVREGPLAIETAVGKSGELMRTSNIPQLAKRLDLHRKNCGGTSTGPIFANSAGHPLDLNACYQRSMKYVLKRAGIIWHGWHGFRRGLASNLNRLGVDDSVIQRILRHSNVATTQNHYIKTASPDAIAAMKQFSEALMCSACAPDGDLKADGSVR